MKDSSELEATIESALVAAHRLRNQFIIYLLEMALSAAQEEIRKHKSTRRAPS